jgi:hypothetical protein
MVKEIALRLYVHISVRKPSVATDNFPSGNSCSGKLDKNTMTSFSILSNFLLTNKSKIWNVMPKY